MIKKLGKKIFSILTKVSPKFSAIILYIYRTKEFPNLKNPTNFNEKMTKLKLEKYSHDEKISMLADKYEVREYVKKKGYGDILNELYGVYDNPEQINFEELPEKFAIKCTHGCAYNIICKDKKTLDIVKTKKQLNKWLREKYGYVTQELHYLKIKPRIIVEKYLCDDNDKLPLDYKFFCFNGKVAGIMVCSERDSGYKLSWYDKDWNRIKYEKDKWSAKENIKKPMNLENMISCAEILSKEFDFVRVDLYNDAGKIIFGELTFTPSACCSPKLNEFGNIELGKMLNN